MATDTPARLAGLTLLLLTTRHSRNNTTDINTYIIKLFGNLTPGAPILLETPPNSSQRGAIPLATRREEHPRATGRVPGAEAWRIGDGSCTDSHERCPLPCVLGIRDLPSFHASGGAAPIS